MTASPDERTLASARRATRRRPPGILERKWGDGFMSFRAWQLLVLGIAVSTLVGLTGSVADAAPFGPRQDRAKSVRVLLDNRFTLGAAVFQTLQHHRWDPVAANRRHHPRPPTTTTTTTTTVPPTSTTTQSGVSQYPIGVVDPTEPSGVAPPTAAALAGYSQSYVNDFSGTSMPSGWYVFTGKPGGDPGAQWASSHVVVGSGLLSLNTWRDPSYGSEWVDGGVCQCGLAQTYGAYFVRSRVTSAGPTNVELLWPSAHVWPPEVDFNETYGGTTSSSATVHWSSANSQDQRDIGGIDMTQWHTWGVIWSPTQLIYTMDGKVWGTVDKPSEIPSQAMTLDLTQQAWCASGWACPTQDTSMQIDWVAEYVPQS